MHADGAAPGRAQILGEGVGEKGANLPDKARLPGRVGDGVRLRRNRKTAHYVAHIVA